MSTDGKGTKCRRKIAENYNRLSRVHERYRLQTVGRVTTNSEREREFTFEKNSEEAWMEYKKCMQSAKRVISMAKEKKQKECASDLNDPEHQNEFFPNSKADGKRRQDITGSKSNYLKGVSSKVIADEK